MGQARSSSAACSTRIRATPLSAGRPATYFWPSRSTANRTPARRVVARIIRAMTHKFSAAVIVAFGIALCVTVFAGQTAQTGQAGQTGQRGAQPPAPAGTPAAAPATPPAPLPLQFTPRFPTNADEFDRMFQEIKNWG